MGLIFNIASIAGGILLGLAMLDKWDGDTNIFNKIAKFLSPFHVTIGGAMLGLGILNLISGAGLLANIVSILGGLLLLTHTLAKLPAVGEGLVKVSDKLSPYKAVIGVASLVLGIMRLF